MTATTSPSDSAPPVRPRTDWAAGSRFVQRIRRRYADLLALLPSGLPERSAMHTLYLTLRQRGYAANHALRIMRHIVQERFIVLDCDDDLDLPTIVQGYTHLAEVALRIAVPLCAATLDTQYGMPRTQAGQRCPLWVMGMGKLGSRELNASSDIDLIYIYAEEGDTAGGTLAAISNHEYFGKLVRAVSAMIAEVNEHGQVFRVDLALRPNGNSGPAAISLAALEDYFQHQGREWERFAWLKSRAVAIHPPEAKATSQPLSAVVLPFVFRQDLDYSVYESLRQLHSQIRAHTAQRSPSQSDACDIKLGRGGIREIEFTVQALQVVRGGQFAELRVRATLQTLPRLVQAALMPATQAEQLAAAYTFLRRLEHRIQYLDDQQTHTLPRAAADVDWIAHTLGLADAAALHQQLQAHRDLVASVFEGFLSGAAALPGIRPLDASVPAWSDIETLFAQAAAEHPADPDYQRLSQQLQRFSAQPDIEQLPQERQDRLLRLMERIAHWLHDNKTQALAVLRFFDWVRQLLQHSGHLALLQERPAVLGRLLRLLGAERWPARYLQRHPLLIDELASEHSLSQRFQPDQLRHELTLRHNALSAAGQDDEATLMDVLRRAHHAEVFRTLTRDVEGRISVEEVADDLSLLADTVLDLTIRWCWQRYKHRHQPLPAIGVIAYGKLGGKELGYGGDLDLVFIYDDAHESAGEIYSSFVRQLIRWMDSKTAEGELFEIDMALRPNGESGLIITGFTAYADYQRQRGSNSAWVWEHQAMTRARLVWGQDSLHRAFDALRAEILCLPREHHALRQHIAAMRQRMASAYRIPIGRFDVKHSSGGMVDCEFAVQYLVLAHAHAHAELIANAGNIALLLRAEAAGLLPAGMGQAAANAYRQLRRTQHRARLNEQLPQPPVAELAAEQQAILQLWQFIFQPVLSQNEMNDL